MSYQTIEVEQKNNILIVRIIKGRIFLTIGEKFKEEFIPLTENIFDKMVIDFSNVEVMNSSGLGVLILARDILDKKNRPITVFGLCPLMHDIFLRMRLDLLFQIFETEEEALSDL